MHHLDGIGQDVSNDKLYTNIYYYYFLYYDGQYTSVCVKKILLLSDKLWFFRYIDTLAMQILL